MQRRTCGPFVMRADERKRIAMHDVARTREERGALEIRVPTDVVDVQVREKDDVDLVARNAEAAERLGQLAFVLRGPAPQPGWADPRVDEDGHASRADEVARARQPPAPARKEVGIEHSVRLPGVCRYLRVRVRVLGDQPDGVGNREELDLAD